MGQPVIERIDGDRRPPSAERKPDQAHLKGGSGTGQGGENMMSIRRVTFLSDECDRGILPLGLVLKDPIVVIPFFKFRAASSSTITLQLGCNCMAEALIMAVMGPSTALARMDALAPPVANTAPANPGWCPRPWSVPVSGLCPGRLQTLPHFAGV